MNRNWLLFFFTVISITTIFGQGVKRYVLLEHFTNSRCSVCASRNPAFFNTIKDYPKLVHHLSIHPSIPYNNCKFYQENPIQNNARKDYYSVFGTPTVFKNGVRTTGSALINRAELDDAADDLSPIEVNVQETSGTNRTATVTVNSVEDPPAGNLVLMVAIVEKTVNYNAPNGEKVHHNVMRKFLTASTGDAITLANKGGQVSLDFPYTVESAWIESEVYLLAWVQNTTTKEVYNSGTRFDNQLSISKELAPDAFDLYPNPTSGILEYTSNFNLSGTVQILTSDGRLLHSIAIGGQRETLDLTAFPSGNYLIRFVTDKGNLTKPVLKN